jgi:hypothetical protein
MQNLNWRWVSYILDEGYNIDLVIEFIDDYSNLR